MNAERIAKNIKGCVALTAGMLVCSSAYCFDFNRHSFGDEETILVEKQPVEKIPYSKILKTFTRQVFSIDADKIMTFGGTHKCNIVRSFADLKDRTQYRFNVRPEEVEVKLQLNF